MKNMLTKWLACVLVCCGGMAWCGGSVVPVGGYLYANEKKLDDAKGSLEVHFATPSPRRMVIALGRKYRKTRTSRDGTTEEARRKNNGRISSRGWPACRKTGQSRPLRKCRRIITI